MIKVLFFSGLSRNDIETQESLVHLASIVQELLRHKVLDYC